MQLPLKHPIFKILSGIAAEKGIEAYVIGGYVRDLLLQLDTTAVNDNVDILGRTL